MHRTVLSVAMSAVFLITCCLPADAADEELKPLAKPGENYVSLQVDGCQDKCGEFEIYIFDTGRLTFRSNNSQTSTKGVLHKSGMRSVYERVAKYLEDTGSLSEPGECTERKGDTPFAVVQSSQDSKTQKATWSSGCSNQLERARSLVKVFVNQTGMWRNINHDSRYWEKYWETWEEKK